MSDKYLDYDGLVAFNNELNKIIPDAQIQSDWNTSNSALKSFIKNKPTKLSQFSNDVGYVTTDTKYVFNSTYNASTNKAATMADVNNAYNKIVPLSSDKINALFTGLK